jgi:hypothetical protein
MAFSYIAKSANEVTDKVVKAEREEIVEKCSIEVHAKNDPNW